MRHGLVILCVISGWWLLAGCSTSGGGAPYQDVDRTPPVISSFNITPPPSDWHGGPCIIEIHATDETEMALVTARISGPNAPADAVVLQLVAGTTDSYVGTGTMPANTNANGQPNAYWVTAWATDKEGNSSTVDHSLSISIPAPDGPPPPP
ncbi:MAG TPA: hypothetical protein VGM23_04845 [Armatimonadota bacterium]|jgi:hypothetical protein